MAAGGNVPELGGYDYEFTNRVPEDWECLVCHLAMKDPVQIVGCGHRLCSICMESLLRRPSPTCPADRQPLSREKIFPDAACHRKILDLTVKCSYFGCSWIGELRSVQKHQSGCLFKVVKCPNSGCTEKLTKQDLKIHVTFECSWRKVNCEYCQTSFIKNQKQKHFGVCQKFPVQCTNKCGLRDIPREKLDVHVRDECPATEVQCEYKNLGCEAVIFPDTACRRQILDLTVKCSYSKCSWTGELRAVEKHLSECLFKVVECPNSGCTEKVTEQDLKIHLANECSWRKVNCDYCQESYIVNQKQEHFGVCGKFPVQCTKCGLRDIPREKLDAHVRDECPATEVQCEYKNLGCEEVIPRSNAKSHSESQVERHLNLAIRGLEVTQLQVNELVSLVKVQSQQIDQQTQQIERQSQQIERQSQQIERLVCKDKEQSQQIELLMTKDEEQSQQIERLMSKDKDQSQQKEQLMFKEKEKSPQMERHEQINKTPFEWKIPNCEDIRRRARVVSQTIVSEPFYLFKGGYRYTLKFTFDSKSALRFFSLYIKLVTGEFDSLLSWPCKEKVRVTLIDQDRCKDKRQDISDVVVFEKDERPCFRPHANDAKEYRLVLQIQQKTLRTRSYIKNDTIFIMVNKE
ncbi:TNF receptor-associated factor 5-like [Oculina patagonica]